MSQSNKKPKQEENQETADVNVENLDLPKAPPLTIPRFGLAEETRNIWRCSVTDETHPNQCLEEGFWANVANLLQPGDTIQVLCDSYRWRMDLFVVASGNTWAQVSRLALYDLSPARPHTTLPSKYQINFAGAHHKWRVIRDGEPIKDGFASEALARKWAANHEAAVNR